MNTHSAIAHRSHLGVRELLPLFVNGALPTLVSGACQRLHSMEARSGADHVGSGQQRHLQLVGAQSWQMVEDVWRLHP